MERHAVEPPSRRPDTDPAHVLRALQHTRRRLERAGRLGAREQATIDAAKLLAHELLQRTAAAQTGRGACGPTHVSGRVSAQEPGRTAMDGRAASRSSPP